MNLVMRDKSSFVSFVERDLENAENQDAVIYKIVHLVLFVLVTVNQNQEFGRLKQLQVILVSLHSHQTLLQQDKSNVQDFLLAQQKQAESIDSKPPIE